MPQTEHSDQPNTLPLPELNPLLNPLLGENMGRWAEVYYRNPPENRERAVLELLQQLEVENSAERTGLTPTPPLELAPSPPDRTRVRQIQSPMIHCESCGHKNPENQQFCGMCGVPIRSDAIKNLAVDEALRGGESARRTETETDAREPENEFLRLQDPAQELDRSQDHDNGAIQLLSSERARPYRVYIGGTVAIVVLALGFAAWKGGSAKTGSSVAVQAPPAMTQKLTAPSGAAAPAKIETPRHNPPEKIAEASGSQARAINDSVTGHNNALNAAALVAKEPRPQLPTAAENGSEELALAQTYLNGTEGHVRDNAQAADWLWKAVAKRNAAATLLLSDLYLRGNGVAKNCEQARVLLDAAASRGIRDAAVRLRNTQAFGCQ